MDATRSTPQVIGDGNTTSAGGVEANTDRGFAQEQENSYDMRETDPPKRPEKPRRKRGRSAKNPLNQTFSFQCRDAEDLETMLRDFLTDSTSPPEHTTVEFRFPVSAAFMVYPPGHSQAIKDPLKRIFSRKAVSVIEALQPTFNPKDRLEKQRSIAKVCVEAVSNADGFKYGFNNNWISKEDGASRFSYFCNDSSLNKARAGNPAASNRVAHKKAQKPVYECEGTIFVKFWASKQLLEVICKHIPCHETYAARAPVPRNGTRRRILMEVFESDKLPAPRIPGGQSREVKAEKRRSKARLEQPHSASDVSSSVQPRHSREGCQNSLAPILQLVNTIEAKASMPASNEPPIFLAEKLMDMQNVPTKSRPTTKKRKSGPAISTGASSEFMDDGEICVERERPTKKQRTANDEKSKKGQSDQDATNVDDDGIIAPASDESTVLLGKPSELEILKMKLAQAEQRIQRLEAEKNSTAPPSPQPYCNPLLDNHQAPPPQYQHPPQQQWLLHPGYGPTPPVDPCPRQIPPYTGYNALKPTANVYPKHAPHARFGLLKRRKPAPSLPGGLPPMSLGISEMAAGASEEANRSSGGTSARAQTLNEAIVSGNLATSRSGAIGSLNQEPALAPKGVPAGFNAVESSATSEPARGMRASNSTSDETPTSMNENIVQLSTSR